jgi:hypothetical protein
MERSWRDAAEADARIAKHYAIEVRFLLQAG